MTADLAPFLVFYPWALIVSLLIAPASIPRARVVWFVLLGLALRLPLSVLCAHYLPFDDELTYVSFGESIADALTEGAPNPWEGNSFANLAGVLFLVLGVSEYALRAFNTFLGIVTAFLLYRIATHLTPDVAVRNRVLRWAMFAPPCLFLSCLALKEQLVGTLAVLVVHAFVRGGAFRLVYLALSVGLLLVFRKDLALLLIPVGLFLTALSLGSGGGSRNKRFIGSVLCAVGIVAALVQYSFHTEALEESKMIAILKGEDRRGEETLMESGATYARLLDPTSPTSIINLMIPPVHSLYSPSPFQVLVSPEDRVFVLTLLVTVFTYLWTPYLLIAVWRLTRRLTFSFLILTYLVIYLSAAYSILTAAPEPFRYRWPGLPLLSAVAAFGYSERWRYRKHVIWLWWVSAVIFGYVYVRAFNS